MDNYILEDDTMNIVSYADEDVDSRYFSDDDLPVEEMNEVSDDWFMSHLMDDTASVTPAKSDTRSHKKEMLHSGELTKKDMAKSSPEDFHQEITKSDITKIVPGADDRKAPPKDIVPQMQDDNGLIFGPSCVGQCFTKDLEWNHE